MSTTTAIANIKSTLPANDAKTFESFLTSKMANLKMVAASHLNPQKIVRVVLSSVSRTPALRECSMISIYRSVLQSMELGLEPGSAVGEAYLVPFRERGVAQCQLIVGYRGLISLAFRSGHVKAIRANVVYQGDHFDYRDGLSPVLEHKPSFEGRRDPSAITFAYCVIQLADGGVIFDVMTRTELDAIRARSKASQKGPWVTDTAEMMRKTVARRCLKYAPMSVEMGKAMALDAVEAGEVVDADFDLVDDPDLSLSEPEEPTKTDRIRDKLPSNPAEPVYDTETGEKLEGQEGLL